MIFRIAGLFFVFVSSTLLGFYYGAKATFRLQELREMKKALTILKSEIQYLGSPILESLVGISDKIENPFSNIFLSVADEISFFSGEDIFDIWSKSVLKNIKDSYLEKEDIHYLISFGKCLGYLDKNMQYNNMNLTINYIEEKINLINEDVLKNKKMYNSLGIIFGLLLCIIFI